MLEEIAYLQGDFEPTKIIPGISGVYTCKSKVNVNHEGTFKVMMVNTTKIPVYIPTRKLVGKIYPPSQVLWCSTGSPHINVDNFGIENMVPNIENLSLGESASQKQEIVESLSKFPQVFAQNPKKPGRTDWVESNPVKQKNRRMPVIWEKEADN